MNRLLIELLNINSPKTLSFDDLPVEETLKNFFEATKQVPEFAIMAPYIREKKDENKKNHPFEVVFLYKIS